ncbi:ARM repeat-containing protein [Dacryopinax primogenitus]|uniref:ARM repeat-containing protein n=1 Tax=Dacryopinax primogenitus (strain DJM 731) TaxID=1858805 RepID=M5FTW5_DACPD|nr:ARM repeat-containing protein [Dacryopinax primogenitus]EJT96656.1 ARM repeat-containing protein [Dacryopinax primogenitus]
MSNDFGDQDTIDFSPPKPQAKPPARLMARKAETSSSAASAPSKKAGVNAGTASKGAKGASAQATDTFKYKHTPEAAEELIVEVIPSTVIEGYGDANWKARLAAVEELEAWVNENAEVADSEIVFRFLGGKKRDWNEKNFQVSAKVYTIMSILADKSPSFGKPSAALAIPHLSEKLGDIKLKKPAGDTLILFAEKTSLSFVLSQAYEPMSKQKAPKVQADSLIWIGQALTEFGIAGLNLRSLVDFLKVALGNPNAAVRAAATSTFVTFRLFAGTGIKDFLDDLNPQLLNTISAEFDKVEGTPAPEPIRTQAEVSVVAASSSSGGANNAAAMDSLYPRVDLDKIISSQVLTDALSDAWKVRKEAMDSIQATLSEAQNKRLEPNMGEIAQVLKARVADTNKAVQTTSLDVVAKIALGMGKPFERYSRILVAPVAGVLADQKMPTRAAALRALTEMANACEEIETFIPGIATALESANPLLRSNLLNWAAEWFKEHPASSSLDLSSWISPVITCLDDKSGDVRKGAQAVLPTVIATAGVDSVLGKLGSFKGATQQAVRPLIMAVKVEGGLAPSKPVARPEDSAASVRPKKPRVEEKPAAPQDPVTPVVSGFDDEPGMEDASPKPLGKPPARLMAKKPAAPPAAAVPQPKKIAAAPAVASAKSAKSGPPQATDTFKYKHTPDDAEGLIVELIPPSIAAGYADPNWKARLAAVEEMETWASEQDESLDSELVFRFLGGKKRDWNEKNFQVSSKVYNVLSILAERCPTFGKPSAALAIAHLTDKLGDMKLKKPASDTLGLFAEKTSLSFVLSQAYEPMSKQKAPKMQAESLNWIGQVLNEFGVAGLNLRALVDFLKNALGNSNAAVRSAATSTLVTLRLFAGTGIKDFLSDLNPQLLNTISAEFDKAEGKPTPEPTRTQADLSGLAPTSSGGGGGDDPMDSLYPRVDLDKIISGKVLADAKSDAWKTRKEALETAQAILNEAANKRLKPNMGEIGQVLKARVPDTNKAVQALTLDIISRIATAMGKPFEKYTRLFAAPVAGVLADQKAPIRAAALLTLTNMANACEEIDTFISGIVSALDSSNPLLRSNLVNWVADWFKDHPESPLPDLTPLAGPVVNCLDDKSGDVRKAAQAVLPTIIAQAGFEVVMGKLSSLKGASQQAVRPLIMAAKPLASGPAAPPSAAAPLTVRPASNAPKALVPPMEHPSESQSATAHPPKPMPTKVLNGISGTTGVRSLRLGATSSRPESRTDTRDDELPPSATGAAMPKTKIGSGLKRPTVVNQATVMAVEAEAIASLPFSGMSLDSKRVRLGRDRARFVFESVPPSKDVIDMLQQQMEPHTSKALVAQLFSHDHNADRDHMLGVSAMDECFIAALNEEDKYGLSPEDAMAILIANSDLPLKYCSIRLQDTNPTMTMRCLELISHILELLNKADYTLTDGEVAAFVPTMIGKLGDSREVTREKIRGIFRLLEKQYPYSKIFQLLMEYGLQSKNARTRQSSLEDMASLLNRYGMSICQPSKAFPAVAVMVSDRDTNVRQAALSVIGEGYGLVGDAIWSHIGVLSPKDKTLIEERLRRLAPPAKPEPRATNGIPRSLAKASSIARAASPGLTKSHPPRAMSPGPSKLQPSRAMSPGPSALPSMNRSGGGIPRPGMSALPVPGSRPKSMLPSRLGAVRSRPASALEGELPQTGSSQMGYIAETDNTPTPRRPSTSQARPVSRTHHETKEPDTIEGLIKLVMSNDMEASIRALKKIQERLDVVGDAGEDMPAFTELSQNAIELVESIQIRMQHLFEDRSERDAKTWRLTKHLITTLSNFIEQPALARCLNTESLTALLEELTLRLLQTDEAPDPKGKDTSRYINMVLLKLFTTAERISVFRALFTILLRLARDMTSLTTADSEDAKVVELILKCIWKMARSIPEDLQKELLDPCQLFKCIEAFLQSIPPNEWRARAAAKVPSGDLPLRTVKVIIQHIVQHYGDDTYDQLSASFDDPSATIVYPYVYRILNAGAARTSEGTAERQTRPHSEVSARPASPEVVNMQEGLPTSDSVTSLHGESESLTPSRRHGSILSEAPRSTTPSRTASTSTNGYTAHGSPGDDDPDQKLIDILDHISSETTGSLHKQGITELYQFLKAHPHKRTRVDRMLDKTGPQFKKYIMRALASRAEDDEERELVFSDTLSKLESNPRSMPSSPQVTSPQRTPSMSSTRRASLAAKDLSPEEQTTLHRLHGIFGYRSSTAGSPGRPTSGSTVATQGDDGPRPNDVLAQLRDLRDR